MIRSLIVLGLIALGIRYSLGGPFYILLFYLWNAYFRPEQWVWNDFVSGLYLSFLVGAALVVTTFLSGKRFRIGLGPILLFLLLGLSLLSTIASPVSSYSLPFWVEFAKAIVVSYMIIVLVKSEGELRLSMIVIALSLGFEGAKQGWAELIRNPGSTNANPLPGIGDNNGVAVAMLMLAPLFIALARTAGGPYQRYVAFVGRFFAIGVIYRALSTYSRGGFLAAVVLGLHYLVRSRRRLAAIMGILILTAIVLPVLPPAYWDRMGTLGTTARESEAERLYFWSVAIDMANANPFFGVGHNAYNAAYNQYDRTFGEYGQDRSVHSTWFGVLAELGYPGFVIFLTIFIRALIVASRVRTMAKVRPELATLAIYATAIEAQLLVFAVGGTFLPLQYTEFLWHTIALSIAVEYIARERAVSVPAAEPVRALSPAAAVAGRVAMAGMRRSQ